MFVFQDQKLTLLLSVWNWISWNLTKFQLIQLIQTIVIFIFSMGCLIELKLCEVSRNSFSNWFWNLQLSILKNKKVLSLKKYFLSRCQYQNKKALFTDSIFREGFGNFHVHWRVLYRNGPPLTHAMLMMLFWFLPV